MHYYNSSWECLSKVYIEAEFLVLKSRYPLGKWCCMWKLLKACNFKTPNFLQCAFSMRLGSLPESSRYWAEFPSASCVAA